MQHMGLCRSSMGSGCKKACTMGAETSNRSYGCLVNSSSCMSTQRDTKHEAVEPGQERWYAVHETVHTVQSSWRCQQSQQQQHMQKLHDSHLVDTLNANFFTTSSPLVCPAAAISEQTSDANSARRCVCAATAFGVKNELSTLRICTWDLPYIVETDLGPNSSRMT